MSDDGEKVDHYIAELVSPQRETCERLRALIRKEFPLLVESFRWNRPVYAFSGNDVCYLKANQADVSFGFNLGAALVDAKGLLRGTGISMRHMKVCSPSEFELNYCRELLNQSIALLDGP